MKETIYSDHALCRLRERGITEAVVSQLLADPALDGRAMGDARFAAGAVLVGARRDWLVVIYKDVPNRRIVLTAYVGVPHKKATEAAQRVAERALG